MPPIRGETLPARIGHGMPRLAGNVRLITRVDKEHICNHLIFNVVSFTRQKHITRIRRASERLIPVSPAWKICMPSYSVRDTRSNRESIFISARVPDQERFTQFYPPGN